MQDNFENARGFDDILVLFESAYGGSSIMTRVLDKKEGVWEFLILL
jgi:hypothetical protein